MPNNTGEVVKVLRSNDPTRRVAIVQRPDGYYAIRPERLVTGRFHPKLVVASKWLPLEDGSGVFADADLAEREAYASHPWVRRISD